MNPSAPSKCQRPCVESCLCNTGYLLSAGKCVLEGDCGCERDGRYYKAGESFWEDEGCQTWCECDPQSKRVECWSQTCGHQERCEVVKGLRRCQPLTYGTCTAVGDPHYHTFDSLKFDFMGTCVYLLVGVCANDTGLTPFEVQVQNENRGNKAVSFTRLGWIIVYGQNIVLSREHVGK
ncbi:hypothetical protein chiPu_0032241, partial [Chiloscyllium punctatum]|nr:hypothetical protein [Chiloscyllium punctatum]